MSGSSSTSCGDRRRRHWAAGLRVPAGAGGAGDGGDEPPLPEHGPGAGQGPSEGTVAARWRAALRRPAEARRPSTTSGLESERRRPDSVERQRRRSCADLLPPAPSLPQLASLPAEGFGLEVARAGTSVLDMLPASRRSL